MPVFRKKDTSRSQTQNSSPSTSYASPKYPIEHGLAVYGRLSTKNQVENSRESYEAQTKDLLKRALDMGWKEGSIIVYIENIRSDGAVRSASGRLRIDQREGLRALIERIEAGEVKAVMVYQEDRLFRDETGIQYNTFIGICKRNNCIIITPWYTYDFNNDRYAVRIFRDKMQQAADFYVDYSRRMLDLKARVSQRGDYDGRAIAVGYVVDRNRQSRTWKKYIVYEPHAQVVRWLFKRYRELCGNLRALCRELDTLPYVFPPFDTPADARNITRFRLTPVPGGYHISRAGLKSLLTNVAYVGWWVFQQEVVQKDNHPAIVDEDDFWYAFNRLSAFTPDGEENTAYTPITRYTMAEGEQKEVLLSGVLESDDGTVYQNNQHIGGPVYTVVDIKSSRLRTVHLYAVKTAFLDAVFVERMIDVASNEYLGDDILAAIEAVNKQKQEPLISVEEQLTTVNTQIDGRLASLRLPETVLDMQSREEIALELKGLRDIQKSLLAKKNAATPHFAEKKDVEEYRYILNHLSDVWYGLPLEKRLKVIKLVVEKVRIKDGAPHWIGIQIEWRGFYGRADLGYIWRGVGSRGPAWTEEEYALLTTHYSTAERSELMALFPSRSWLSMGRAATQKGLRRSKGFKSDVALPRGITLCDLTFMDTVGIELEDITKRVQAFWMGETPNRKDEASS